MNGVPLTSSNLINGSGIAARVRLRDWGVRRVARFLVLGVILGRRNGYNGPIRDRILARAPCKPYSGAAFKGNAGELCRFTQAGLTR